MSLEKLRQKLNQKLVEYETAKSNVRQEGLALKQAKKKLTAVIEAQEIVQGIAAGVQASAHKQLASVVTRCFEAVFDTPYEFKINFLKKRGKTEAQIVFVRDGYELENPMDEAGGGPVAVAAFALRLAALLLTKPQPRRLLVMDEPFAHVSEEYITRIGQLLQTLAEEMGFQFVLVTHNRELEVGKVIKISGG